MTLSGRFRAVSVSFAGALLLLWATNAVLPAQTPTLGEVARKEEERRKKIATPAKVYTNKDLPKTGAVPAPPPAAAGAPSAAPKAEETQKPEEPEGEVKDEAWWRKRITAVRTELQRNEMAAEAFQSRVNALTADFSARDDPYQRAQLSIERQKVLNELERVKVEIVRLKQSIADIEEEARVAGVPPGWLR
jgi:hypothetical protein